MKKLFALVLTAVMLLALAVPAMAAPSKADLLAEAAKSPVYKYIKPSVENAMRTIEITDEQAEALLPLIQEGVAIVPEDKGPTADNDGRRTIYTQEQIDQVTSVISRACDVLGFTYTIKSAATVKGSLAHAGDIVINVYDQDGKLVFQYDGDMVEDTGDVSATTNATAWVLVGVACATVVLAGASFVIARKKVFA